MTIRGLAPAAQRDSRRLATHEKQRRALTDVDAIAVAAEGITAHRAERFQRREAGQRERA
jgi:hypothetical protein